MLTHATCKPFLLDCGYVSSQMSVIQKLVTNRTFSVGVEFIRVQVNHCLYFSKGFQSRGQHCLQVQVFKILDFICPTGNCLDILIEVILKKVTL